MNELAELILGAIKFGALSLVVSGIIASISTAAVGILRAIFLGDTAKGDGSRLLRRVFLWIFGVISLILVPYTVALSPVAGMGGP